MHSAKELGTHLELISSTIGATAIHYAVNEGTLFLKQYLYIHTHIHTYIYTHTYIYIYIYYV